MQSSLALRAFQLLIFTTLVCIAPAGLRAQSYDSGVEYANPGEAHLALDIAYPEGEGPFPAVVCIHGGGFCQGDLSEFGGPIQNLANRGFVACTITYRLAPDHPFPAAIEDCKAAVRWLRANAGKYHIDPDHIGVTGASAGGNLALLLGVTGDKKQFEGDGGNPDRSSRVQCVVSYFGPSDLTKSYGKSVDAADLLPQYLGGNLEEAREKHVEASPITWVTSKSPPTLCIHGTKDEYVELAQSQWIVDKLKKAGVEAEILVMEDAGHGFEGEDYDKAEAAMIEFFEKHLKK